ncbi:MAG TPA: GNAT family N-acetyltransferase [Pyrinomonadaceae bacterium]|nr:GNAT family N-acetyltransferase [Pyrinomonadaceae bacterium]
MAAQRSLKVFRGRAGFFELEQEWKTVTNSIPGKRFFHLYEWHRSYVEALEKDDDSLRFFVAYHGGGEIEAIFPLKKTRQRRFGIIATVLEAPHHPHLLLKDILICGDMSHSGLLTDLVEFLTAQPEYKCDVIRVEGALEDSGILELMAGQPHVLNVWEEMGYCDYLPVMPKESYREGLSRNFRAQLRKARNKALKHGGTRCLSTRDPIELDRFFRHFLDIEGSGWKRSQGTAIILDPSLRAFYECLVRYFSVLGACEINLLELDSAIIAAQFSLVVGKTMYILKIGYDDSWSSVSPGNLLLENVLERCKKNGTVQYVNLVTDAAWHRSWQPKQHRVFYCQRFNATVPGLLAFVLFYAKRAVRALRSGLGRHSKRTRAEKPSSPLP